MAKPKPKASPTPTPTPAPTPKPVTPLGQLLKDFGIELPTPTPSSSSTPKPVKSGTYTSTQTSSNIPADDALQSYINNTFQKYYGRDANQSELDSLLPTLQAQFKSPDGKSKTTVKQNYKNGQLVSTDYFTANGEDPKLWLDNQIKNELNAGIQDVNTLNIPEGPAGKYFVTAKRLAAQNGVMLSDSAATAYANSIVSGKVSEDTVFSTIRESAANAFPSMADKIKQGIDLKTLADPYIQSMSNILEVPDTAIDLFDPKIRGALSFTLPDGKVGTKSIYDFEKELRQDPRWQYTKNARQQASSIATTVLKDFGFMG
jgi:hypothetical protein